MARALAWHARGRRFEPDSLHTMRSVILKELQIFFSSWLERPDGSVGKVVGPDEVPKALVRMLIYAFGV